MRKENPKDSSAKRNVGEIENYDDNYSLQCQVGVDNVVNENAVNLEYRENLCKQDKKDSDGTGPNQVSRTKIVSIFNVCAYIAITT